MARSILKSLAVMLCLAAAPAAADMAKPEGMVILTVAGNVGETNRGPAGAEDWTLMAELELTFDKAVEFDAAMLDALDQSQMQVPVPGGAGMATFTGPSVAALLKAVGAQGKGIRAVAFDNFSAEISADLIAQFDPIVATRMDGRPLPLGGRGPAMIVFPDGKTPEQVEQFKPLQVWAMFYISVD
ncbi:hypothetical protein [Chachezhania sediminis]|uniref:hypothetical protein n=1 Tax=Chachezhania sediminis TaxID=2599291 RepID=UPI00131BC61B|nr:hypothetical protein [Chachezhania sediminis]